MKKQFLLMILILSSLFVNAQVMLNRIGQTPGGAAYNVNYDSISKHLYVGVGTSLLVYDMSVPDNPILLARRPFMGLINETILYNGVLFVAATHDGVYALDINSDTLAILDHYPVNGLGDIGAYDMCQSGDTLFIADKNHLRIVTFTLGTFHFLGYIPSIPPLLEGDFCVAENSNYIAVGKQGAGQIDIYKKNDLSLIASWTDSNIVFVQNLRFSDNKDSILYVCGGPTNILLLQSYFFALELNGTQLNAIDSFCVSGLPLVAEANITGIDSRNDTVYLATTCAIDTAMGFPLSYTPILDASGLPNDSLKMIDYVNTGLWHFDVSLMRGTPYMATASEWLGVALNNITTSLPLDTLPFIPTGGWTQKAKVKGDTLWVAHEGWGLAAYNIDSLMFSHGYMTDSRLLHIYSQQNHFFVGDFEFLNDTLLILSNGNVYNLKPWQQGGQPALMYSLNFAGIVHNVYTGSGQRLIVGSESIFGTNQTITLYNPFDSSGDTLRTLSILNDPYSITVKKDTMFYGMRTDTGSSIIYLAASLVENDNFTLLDTIATTNGTQINAISVEDNLVAVSKGNTIEWYHWNGGHFTYIGNYFSLGLAVKDLELKNHYLYVADRFFGVKIFDISQPTATLLAKYEQYVGWCGNFGDNDICVGDNGQIYLSDFNAGVIIIQAYDTTLSSSGKKPTFVQTNTVHVYPNPASNQINIQLTPEQNKQYQFEMYSIKGQLIDRTKISGSFSTIDTKSLANGTYLYQIKANNNVISNGKIVINK